MQADINQLASAGAIVVGLLNYNATGRVRFWLSAIWKSGNRWPEFTATSAEFPETLKCVAFIIGKYLSHAKVPGGRAEHNL